MPSSSADGAELELLDKLVTRLVLAANAACVVLLTIALSGGEWSVGVAVHAGVARLAYVSLGQVRLESPDERLLPDYVSLRDLCLQNYSRPVTMTMGMDGRPAVELLETPHDVWCAFETAGASTSSLLQMAWLPALLALGATSVYELKVWVAPFRNAVSRAAALGLTARLFNYLVLFLWCLLWLLLVMALAAFASLSPGGLGIGDAAFGASFGLVRAMVLLTSVCGMGLASHTLELWCAACLPATTAAPPLGLRHHHLLHLLLLLLPPSAGT
jgi:hypothetical protein